MLKFIKIISAAALIWLVGCEQESPGPDNVLKLRPLTYEEETLLKSSNEFSFELLRMLNNQDPGNNTIFSSFGVGNGIGMAFNIMEKRPKEELKNFLKISQVRDIDIHRAYYELGEILNLIDMDVQFTRANSLWINNENEEIDPLSSDKIMAYYDADVEYIDFRNSKNIKTVNRWAEDRTFGKIDHVMDTLKPYDRSYIINAIHFDVHWSLPFTELSLDNLSFTGLEGKQFPLKNINLYSGTYGFYADEDLSLVDIPLGNKKFHLSLLIPGQVSDFSKVIDGLEPDAFNGYLERTVNVENEVLLPKIDIDAEVSLKDLFPEFGLTGPIQIIENFYPVYNLFISDFIHKTSIRIGSNHDQEKTAPGLSNQSERPLIIDRPFIFLVREQYTGAIVFTGKMVRPSH